MNSTEIETQAQTTNKDDRFEAMARWSNIPLVTSSTHLLMKFIPIAGTEGAYHAALDFISGKARHPFLTFFGGPGTGKTHLAIGISWHWLWNNLGLVKYFQAESLLDDLREGFTVSTDEQHYQFDEKMRRLKEVPLLILDDLGVEQSTEWARAKLDEIIDYRYINRLHTVITSNLAPSKLEPRVASRLQEGVTWILQCEDFRLKKETTK